MPIANPHAYFASIHDVNRSDARFTHHPEA